MVTVEPAHTGSGDTPVTEIDWPETSKEKITLQTNTKEAEHIGRNLVEKACCPIEARNTRIFETKFFLPAFRLTQYKYTAITDPLTSSEFAMYVVIFLIILHKHDHPG